MRFISQLRRFHEYFTLKEGTVPIPFSRNRPENHSHNLEIKHFANGWVYSKLAPFHSLYPFHLSIPFTSISLSPLYPFHLSISLSYLSLILHISPSTFFSLYFLLSLFSLSFFLAYLMDVFVLVFSKNCPFMLIHQRKCLEQKFYVYSCNKKN